MKVVGATTTFAAYQATTELIGQKYDRLDSVSDKRKRAEDMIETRPAATVKAWLTR